MVRYWKHRGKFIAKLVEPHVEKFFPYHKPELERIGPYNALLTGKIAKAPFELALGQVEPFGQSLHPSYKDIIKVRIHKLCLNRFILKVSFFCMVIFKCTMYLR